MFPLKLTIETDRKQYDLDDTVVILARFSDNHKEKIQFAEGGCGTRYFYLVTEPVSAKAVFTCQPMSRNQFASAEVQGREMLREGVQNQWLKLVDDGLSHQMAVHLPRRAGIPVGQYKWRVGYTVGAKADLVALIKKETGEKADLDRDPVSILKGAFEGALLSEPVTITIGPDKEKK